MQTRAEADAGDAERGKFGKRPLPSSSIADVDRAGDAFGDLSNDGEVGQTDRI
jgi:hypothetical protein